MKQEANKFLKIVTDIELAYCSLKKSLPPSGRVSEESRKLSAMDVLLSFGCTYFLGSCLEVD
jgi:hypothetical protein